MLKSAAIVGTMKSKYAEAFGDPVGKVCDVCCVLCAVLIDAQCKSSVSCVVCDVRVHGACVILRGRMQTTSVNINVFGISR
jgi:hypothetical protein